MKNNIFTKVLLLLLFVSAIAFVSCSGTYSGDVVVTGKNVTVSSNAFHSEMVCFLYGEIGNRLVKWMVTEYEYNNTEVGDTVTLYHTEYWYTYTSEKEAE